MNTQITNKNTTSPPSAIALMASNLGVDPSRLLSTLKETVFKGASDAELLTLIVVANNYGLNPLLKEIYAFPAKGGGISPIVSIDGWIKIVNRQADLNGMEFDMEGDGSACTCRIYVKGREHPVEVTEYKEECFRNTEPWKQMPRRMLRHKALIQCARVAFGFSGIFDEDEARDIQRESIAAIREPIQMPKAKAVAEVVVVPERETVKAGDVIDAEFAADTPQRSLALQLAEVGVSEAAFIRVLKDHGIKTDTIAGLSDDMAESALFEFSDLIKEIKK